MESPREVTPQIEPGGEEGDVRGEKEWLDIQRPTLPPVSEVVAAVVVVVELVAEHALGALEGSRYPLTPSASGKLLTLRIPSLSVVRIVPSSPFKPCPHNLGLKCIDIPVRILAVWVNITVEDICCSILAVLVVVDSIEDDSEGTR